MKKHPDPKTHVLVPRKAMELLPANEQQKMECAFCKCSVLNHDLMIFVKSKRVFVCLECAEEK